MQTIRTVASAAALAAALALAPQADAQNLTRSLLFSSPNHTTVGETVNLTVQVDGLGGGAPTGAVDFSDNGVALGSATLVTEGAGQTALAAGFDHTCGLTRNSGARCWGYNGQGELGDGTTRARLAPTIVVGLSTGVTALATEFFHTCALTQSGSVKCWGFNDDGQLGDGTTTTSLIPVDVVGLSQGVVAIATGYNHTCALTRIGGVQCWGSNFAGQLGNRSTADSSTPVHVFGLGAGVVALAGGDFYTCALTSSGGIKCWGDNTYGQLGDGTDLERHAPRAVEGLTTGVAALAAGGGHTCAVTATGGAKCWGDNVNGRLGDGTTVDRHTPVDVVGLTSGVASVSAGDISTCALTTAGGVKCWGDNVKGQLGDGTTTNRKTAVDVLGLSAGISGLAVGGNHTCALTSGGALKCWGWNAYGQLGDGTRTTRLTPTDSKIFSGLVRARAKFTTSSLVAGMHVLRATYPGDAQHSGSTAVTKQTVK